MRVGIVGLGLIGTSIGLGLKKWQKVHQILGHDGLRAHEAEAIKLGAVEVCAPLEQIAQCDLVFIAVPPSDVISIAMVIEQHRSDATFVTDCASVKSEIAKWTKGRKRRYWFVPGHPMGGTEYSGPMHAEAVMFEGKPWILCPPKNGGKTAFLGIEEAVRALGAIPMKFDAAAHDAQIAILSHLPHLISGALLVQSRANGAKLPAGGSWRDFTRVGGSNPDLWTQISFANRKDIIKALSAHIKNMSDIRVALRRKNEPWLRTLLTRASEIKRKAGDS